MNAPPTISAPPPAPDLGGWLHDLSPFAFRISGDFGVRWYGLAYIAGFIVAYALLRMLARRRHLRVATPACPRLRAPQRPADDGALAMFVRMQIRHAGCAGVCVR